MNEVYNQDEWFKLLCDSEALIINPIPNMSSFYNGKLIIYDFPYVKVMQECDYCGTSPFLQDSRYPRTCAKCGAPV